MEFLSGYGDEEGEDKSASAPSIIGDSYNFFVVNAAPLALTTHQRQLALAPSSAESSYRTDQMLGAAHGPAHPSKPVSNDKNQIGMGNIDVTMMEDCTFNEQFRSFQRYGYSLDTDTNEILGDKSKNTPENMYDIQLTKKPKREKTTGIRHRVGDVDVNSLDIWEIVPEKAVDPLVDAVNKTAAEKVKETAKKIGDIRSKAGDTKPTTTGAPAIVPTKKPWFVAPAALRKGADLDIDCFIPKKCVKQYKGHTKGVQDILLFPSSAHLLLSASLDGKMKIWDVYNDRAMLQTYSGHGEGVRSIHFNSTGSQFVSASYDKTVKLWDTELGVEVHTFSNKKLTYQVKFCPVDDNVFLCASADNKIYQWDIRSKDICQEYNYHLQACNTITFFDNGRKFVSTADDKKILVWEYDIPVPIKYIAEQDMCAMPAVTAHPTEDFLAAQSMDNSIVVYSCGDKVRHIRKKTFKGHNNTGYACQIGFSPNGKFMISGDGHGKLFVWDWKRTKMYRSLHAHEGGPCIGALWHPHNPSWVFTCGWDGLIKLWD